MKIFLDTAQIHEIKKWTSTGIIDGITTNPTHLYKEGGNPTHVVKTICALLPEGDISVEVTESEPAKVYAQAKEIASLADNITVKIPCHLSYYHIIDTLVTEGIALNITLVFNLIQATAMCKLGVAYISPFIGRWDDIGVNGMVILQEIIDMVDEYNYEAQVLAASLRHVAHLRHAISLGADVITTSPAVLGKALSHPLTDKGIELFNKSWEQLGTSRFP